MNPFTLLESEAPSLPSPITADPSFSSIPTRGQDFGVMGQHRRNQSFQTTNLVVECMKIYGPSPSRSPPFATAVLPRMHGQWSSNSDIQTMSTPFPRPPRAPRNRWTMPRSPGRGLLGRTAFAVGSIASSVACLRYFPRRGEGLLGVISSPMILVVQIPQIVKNFRQKHTGEMAGLTVLLAFVGACIGIPFTVGSMIVPVLGMAFVEMINLLGMTTGYAKVRFYLLTTSFLVYFSSARRIFLRCNKYTQRSLREVGKYERNDTVYYD